MQFVVYGVPQVFVPIRVFRDRHDLPSEFGVSLFLPKEMDGLASIDRAGDALRDVRAAVLETIPTSTPPQGWMAFNLALQLAFQRALVRANPAIGLKASEIQFAVAGFGEVCQLYLHGALRSRMYSQPPPNFHDVYRAWHSSSIEIARSPIRYSHRGEVWRVSVIRDAYGRMGLLVNQPSGDQYVYDAELGCPAAGFMVSLLEGVSERISAIMQHEIQEKRI